MVLKVLVQFWIYVLFKVMDQLHCCHDVHWNHCRHLLIIGSIVREISLDKEPVKCHCIRVSPNKSHSSKVLFMMITWFSCMNIGHSLLLLVVIFNTLSRWFPLFRHLEILYYHYYLIKYILHLLWKPSHLMWASTSIQSFLWGIHKTHLAFQRSHSSWLDAH